jgi:hypothetical protein
MKGQDELFIKPAIYCFDTSSLIQLREYYPVDLFPDINKLFLSKITSGEIIVCDLVFEELKDHEKILCKLLRENLPKNRKATVSEYLKETQRVVQTHYDNLNKSYNIKAHPVVFACPKKKNTTVVTEEKNSDQSKIPNICQKEEVECINLVDFFRRTIAE